MARDLKLKLKARDRDETLVRLDTVSRVETQSPRRRDWDHIPENIDSQILSYVFWTTWTA